MRKWRLNRSFNIVVVGAILVVECPHGQLNVDLRASFRDVQRAKRFKVARDSLPDTLLKAQLLVARAGSLVLLREVCLLRL